MLAIIKSLSNLAADSMFMGNQECHQVMRPVKYIVAEHLDNNKVKSFIVISLFLKHLSELR